jgi:cytochrome c oxidase subunit 2
MRVSRTAATSSMMLLCAACSPHNHQSVLDVGGPQSARIAALWWLMLPIGAVVWVLVVSVMVTGAWRKRGADGGAARLGENGALLRDVPGDRRMRNVVIGAVAVTVVTLFVVLVADFRVGQALTIAPATKVVPIKIVAHQFWWEVQYPDSIPQNIVTTANEIHIPVGKAVVLELASRDVIHSFWVPSLAGKKDLLPGYTRSLWFRADTPGVYRGQCAEFCGLEHAKMGMLVIAESQEHFDAWIKAQRDSAATPTDSLAKRGKVVFEGTTCAMCHAIAGTPAGATTGPDLTHLASRQTIAAATLPNSEENLYSWISDPQRIKPGTLMPATKLDSRDMHALVAYLRQLK